MRANETRKVGDIHSNGKWMWTEYKPGKFDWRAIKGAKKEEVKEEVKKTTSKKKYTKVQQEVMDRIAKGWKLAFLPTNRMSGDAIFWCYKYDNTGWVAVEKALYPQLRRLLWSHDITDNDKLSINDIDIENSYQTDLHYAGVIGF